MPKITIVIPAYNAAPWLPHTLKSVQLQTHTDFICQVVDDGSTDNTAATFDSCVGNDPRFRLAQQQNAGECQARNAGIGMVETPLVTVLDSDDIWHPTFLARMTTALASDRVRLAWCRFAMFMDGTSQRKPQPWCNVHQTGNIWWDMLLDSVFCMGAWAAKTADVRSAGLFDPSLKVGGDRDFALRLLALCCANDPHAAVGIDEELLFYRQRAGSAVRNSDEALKTEWNTMCRHLEHPLVPAQIRRRGYSFLAFKMAVIAAFGGRDLKTAFHWYARAVRLCPTNMNLYLLPIRKLAMTFSRKEDLPWLHEFLAMPLPAKEAH
ncbi:MAG: glycosyltransferase family 2 protein [Desulfovibrio sp.]|uniref:glycosyltransferase family 2 protein n=1 Tax=Desulfovibrio sp. TaxID=885 RepID=UPI00135E747A|nr:glycosyltransferase family 2 protein [Desulfovibrio sp.]MTJ93306.1 glycosyltransferase family 2 protein [Desulfovibrio sp.]